MPEADIVKFERTTKGEEALVIRDAISNLDNPRIHGILRKCDNFPPDMFKKLLTLDFEPTRGPWTEVFPVVGEKIEDLVIRQLAVPRFGAIEVSDIILYPAAVPRNGPPDLEFHLHQHHIRGFEAMLVLDGHATLSFPHQVDAVAPGVYARSEARDDINLNSGDLVIAPAPVANGWTVVEEGFKFRYIGLPPWSRDLTAQTY